MTMTSKPRHHKSHTGAYKTWQAMRSRCSNPRQQNHHIYENVVICHGWNKFTDFYADMGDRPEGKTIDRIDNEGGYTCGKCSQCKAHGWVANCRWATQREQVANSSLAKPLEINGVTKLTSEWLSIYSISQSMFNIRVRCGMTRLEAMTTPHRKPLSAVIAGEEKTLHQWCETYCIKPGTVYRRIYHGMGIVDAITKPIKKAGK